MWPRIWRGPAGLGFRHCLRTSLAPTVVALITALAAHAFTSPELVEGTAAAAATPWLTLPLLVVAVTCCLAAAHLWPLFAQRQPGADSVRRLQRSVFGGRLAVVTGALFAQLLLSLPLAVGLSAWLDAPASASRHYTATGTEKPIYLVGESVRFSLAGSPEVTSLLLRPRAYLPTGEGATQIAVTCKGKPLTTTPVAFAESGALLRVAIPTQALDQIELTKTAGNVPLSFIAGSVVAVGPSNLPTWGNGILAALVAVSTSAITLLLAALLGLGAGWATLATAICCAQFVQWIGGTGPVDDALLQLMRGQWLL